MPYDKPNLSPVGDHITMSQEVPIEVSTVEHSCSCGKVLQTASSLKGHRTRTGH